MIHALILFVFFLGNIAFAEEKKSVTVVTIDSFILSEDGVIDNAKDVLKKVKFDRTDIINEGVFLKNNGKFSNEKLFAKKRILKYKKMSEDLANMIYLQSISHVNSKNWSVVINNNLITNTMDYNISDVVEILKVFPDYVLLKILYPKPEDVEVDKRIKIIKNKDGSEDLTLFLHINEYLNLSNFKISNGNMLDGSQNVSTKT